MHSVRTSYKAHAALLVAILGAIYCAIPLNVYLGDLALEVVKVSIYLKNCLRRACWAGTLPKADITSE